MIQEERSSEFENSADYFSNKNELKDFPSVKDPISKDDQTFKKRCVSKTIEKGRQTRFHFQRLLNYDYCLLLFCGVNIMLTILYSDADYNEDNNAKKEIAEICLLAILITMIVQVFVTILRYKADLQLQKCQKVLDDQQTLVSSGKIYYLIIEIVVLMLQPYPFLKYTDSLGNEKDYFVKMTNNYDGIQFQFKVNYILVILGFLKLFIILRVILIRQAYMSPRSNRLCRMYGCQSNYLYAIKCLFKDNPMLLIGIVFLGSIFIFALSLRIAERDVNKSIVNLLGSTDGSNDISDFENAIWLTIITMTTVGYGDYYPRTTFGRIIDVVLVVWGTFIVSLMVVVLTNTLNMDQSQKRALIVLNRLQAKKTLKESAAFVITHSCRKYLLKKHIREGKRLALTREDQNKLQSTFYKYVTNFQAVHRVIRSMYEIDDIYEEMTRQFEFINDEINFLADNQKDTIQNLEKYLSNGKEDEEDEEDWQKFSKKDSYVKQKFD